MQKNLDAHYINPKLAKLYDLDSGWSNEREFYVQLAGQAGKNILDLGCGTGLVCNTLFERGHDVIGADPSETMLEIARSKPNGKNIDWICTTAQKFKSDKKFDLIIMTGNAFQVLLEQNDLVDLFRNIKAHLKSDGFFAFETRNPNLDWSSKWNYTVQLQTPDGLVIESRHLLNLNSNRMKFELRYKFSNEELISTSELRFWRHDEIAEQISAAGLYVDRLMGDWDYKDLEESTSKEMVFFVRPKK